MYKLFGCGIDIEELTRFDKHIENNDYSLIEEICTKREFTHFRGDIRLKLALSFSCKEAFFKALGVSWTNSDIFWKDIELLFDGQEVCKYSVHLSEYARHLLVKNNAKIEETSLDYNDELVMFQVVLRMDFDNGT